VEDFYGDDRPTWRRHECAWPKPTANIVGEVSLDLAIEAGYLDSEQVLGRVDAARAVVAAVIIRRDCFCQPKLVGQAAPFYFLPR
jgi:hypothetical protein